MSKIEQKTVSKKVVDNKNFLTKYPFISYILKWTFICTIISLCTGTASAVFLHSLNWVTSYRDSNEWLIYFLPLAGLAIGLLYHYYGKDVEAGNNLLIDAIRKPKDVIPFKMAPFVYVGTLVTHLFGGSAGREGTALQMAASIADQFSKPLKLNSFDRQKILIAAVAGGFGSVFGTPLAGAVFALEFAFIGRLKYKALFPAFITAILADVVTKLWKTPHTHYAINFVPDVRFSTIVYAIIAGCVFGLCAAVFSKLMHFSGNVFKAKISFAPLRPFVGGLIVMGVVSLLGTTKYIGLGIPTIVASFHEQLPAYDFALKMILTILTLSAGFKGGEVTPLFFIGATLGNALSLFIPLPTAILAGMGFVAVFAGATNTPIACIIMATELFGINCGVYTAIACIVSYLVSGNNSIYKQQLVGKSKYPIFFGSKKNHLSDL